MSARIVVLDNYDSYVFNLYQRLGMLTGVAPTVLRNDRTSVAEIRALNPTHLVISPGPGTPEDSHWFGIGTELIRTLGPHVPLLGVCLGHQGIVAAFGGQIVRAERVMHGRTSEILHDGSRLFDGVPSPFPAMRYHSLVADPARIPDCLRITARTREGVVMGVQHTSQPIYGLQFHPESIGTPDGDRLLANFLGLARSEA